MTADEPPEYTLDEQRALTERLRAIVSRIHAGALAARRLDLTLVIEMHGELFDGIRSHAGQHRRAGRGSERLVFGPHRSSHNRDVERELGELFTRVEGAERKLGDLDGENFVEATVELAVWAHAEFIRIHPFEDGNGRVGRLCSSHLLVRHGLRPIPIEAVKQEYTEALNHFYRSKEMRPLVDLFLRLAPVGRDP